MGPYTPELLALVCDLARRARDAGLADAVVIATGPKARLEHGLFEALPLPAEAWMATTATDRWGDTLELRVIARPALDAAIVSANAAGGAIPEPMYAEQVMGDEGPEPLGLFLDVSRDYIGLAIPPRTEDWGLPRASWTLPGE